MIRAWRAFSDPSSYDTETGEVWQYMGTVKKTDREVWVHQFRHRHHPQTKRREYHEVEAPKGWFPGRKTTMPGMEWLEYVAPPALWSHNGHSEITPAAVFADDEIGTPLQILPYHYPDGALNEPFGLGELAYRPGHYEGRTFTAWYYRPKRRGWGHISTRVVGKPQLPQPKENWKTCGCGKEHKCGSCGKPYWIEIHGVADGFCTYCYARG